MKKLVVIVSIILICTSITSDTPTPLKKINQIFNSNTFKITIERLDFGYILNQQVYAFNKSNGSLSVSQIELLNPNQKTTLNNTVLNNETSRLLAEYCISIKQFELNEKDEHKELFNAIDIHDFVYLINEKDTVLLSDVHAKAINGVRNIIENNRK